MRVQSATLTVLFLCVCVSASQGQEPPNAEAPLVGGELRSALSGKRFMPLRNQVWFEFGQDFCRDGRWFGSYDRDNTSGTYEVRNDSFCVNEFGQPPRRYQLLPMKNGARLRVISGQPTGMQAGAEGLFRVEASSC